MTHQVPILITSFTGEPRAELKRHMTKTLVRHLKEKDFFVCLASHSIHDEETQSYCDVFIYDKDNSFPDVSGGHGVAELRSIYNAIAILKWKGFNSFLKTSFDIDPTLDFKLMADKSVESGKEAVTTYWGHSTNTLGTMLFYSTIDFLEKTLSMDEALSKRNSILESVWFESVNSKGVMDKMLVTNPYEPGMFGINMGYVNHSGAGGRLFDYPYNW